MTMWRTRALAAITLAGASALLAAAPARAQGATWVTPNQQASTIPNPSFVVQWDESPDFLDHITMTVWFVPPGQTAPDPQGRTRISVAGQPTTTCAFPQTSSDPTHAVQSGSCSIPGFTASVNGTYYAESAAYVQCVPVGSSCVAGDSNSPNYVINIPPSTPTVTANYDAASGKVHVNWTSDSNAADETFELVRSVDGATNLINISPTSTSYTDTDVSLGHTYTYVVQASRPDVNGGSFSATSDPASPTATVTTPAPPTPTTTTTVPGAGGQTPGSTGGPTTTTKLIAPGLKPPSNYTPSKLDLSAFAAALNAAKAKHGGSSDNGGITSASEADNGYKSQLPYGSSPPNTAEDGGSQAASPPLTRASTNGKDNVRTAAAVAGGLLAIVLAMHGMWLRAEVKRASLLEAVEPEPLATSEFRDFWSLSEDGRGGG